MHTDSLALTVKCLESSLCKRQGVDRESSEEVHKMINNMEGKIQEERLQCLKLWTLEERKNRQDLIEVFRMCNGLSRLQLNELFTSDDNIRRRRRKFICHRG